ncbi:Multidrug resistance-associated protein 5 [Amphibalanus amphitrite]|uniref:Multidrug resistance-associated protein 5 n=1 Tax=Amphibalanus amphitrite TaxID=1232801 RepID=A0A6A4X8J6_AMPAM|nr:Multidrug resistance-associated protein 5 [Amphibalanus amphitrite]
MTAEEPKHLMPGPGRGFLSLYTLSWMTGLMWKACRGQLKPDDIWTLRTEDSCQTNYTRLERHWRQEVANKGPRYASLTRTLIRTFRTRIVTTTVLLLVSNFLALLGPHITMNADELKKIIPIVLSEGLEDVVTIDYGRIGTGCSESRYLRIANPSNESVTFQLRRDPQSHPLGDVFKLCPSYGELAPGDATTVTVKYRPRFPHVKDIDYFTLLFGSAGVIQLHLEGISLAPALALSCDSLNFGAVAGRSSARRYFELLNDGSVPAAFCLPLRSALFSVEPSGGEVAPGEKLRVSVSCWSEQWRPARCQLPLLVHHGPPAGQQHMQLLLGGAGRLPMPARGPFQPPASTAWAVLDVDRVDFGRACLVNGQTCVVHLSNVSERELRVTWPAERRDMWSARPAVARLRPRQTAMFEIIFLPDEPNQLYFGHVEALLSPAEASPGTPAAASIVCAALGHTFADGAETWVPRVQLSPVPLVMPPCPLSGTVATTVTLRNLDERKPLVYDLLSAAPELRVWPLAGRIAPGSLHVLAVQYTASGGTETARARLEICWRLNLHTGHRLQLAVLVSQEVPAAAWTPPQLSLPAACPGMVVHQSTIVRNLTRCRLRVAAEPSDTALYADFPELTLAPNQRRSVLWSCRADQCGTHEFIVPHRLQLLDACDQPLGTSRVHNVRVRLQVVPETISCAPRRLTLGECALGTPARASVTLRNSCAAAVPVLLALLPRPLETQTTGTSALLLPGEAQAPPEAAVRQVTIGAEKEITVTVELCPRQAGDCHCDLTYRLLSEEVDGRPITDPVELAELTLRAHLPRVWIADLEAMCGERFEDKALLWRLLAVDRLNAALAKPETVQEQPLALVFPPRPHGSPPLRLVLLLENPCRVPVGWSCRTAEDTSWLSLKPTTGRLAPGQRQTVSVTVGPMSAAGLACARLRLAVDGGSAVPVTVVATGVESGSGWLYTVSEPPWPGLLLPDTAPERPSPLQSALGRGELQRLALHPVPVGCRVPPLQFCSLYNAGLQPVQFHVHTDALEALAEENYGVSVLRCLDTQGTVPAGGCARLRLLFQPLEAREYSARLPVCVSAPCCHQPLLLTARGTAPGEPAADPAEPQIPSRQQATMPDQQVRLSHRYLQFGALSTHTEQSRLVYLHNSGEDVLQFAWTRRLAAADCCAIYGADSSASGGESAGPVVRPEPAEGVLRPGEVLPVRITLSAGQHPQVYSHTIHLAFRNLTRQRLFELNHAAWEVESQRRRDEFTITEAAPEGTRRPPSPPPMEPAVIYTTLSLSALVCHADDTPLGAEPAWRERVFVPLMSAPAPDPSSDSPDIPADTDGVTTGGAEDADTDAAAAARPSADELTCLRRLLSSLLWQLLRDCELQSALKRLRKEAVPAAVQLAEPTEGVPQRRFRRPRTGEQPLLLERALHSVIFNLMREAATGELQLGEGLPAGLSHTNDSAEKKDPGTKLQGRSILLRQVMLYLNSGSEPVEKAILLVVAMAVARIFSVYFMSAAFGVTCVFTGARASGALQLMVYHKVLRLGSASEQILGKVVNICTNDMERVIEGFRIFAFVIYVFARHCLKQSFVSAAFFMTGYGFVVNLLYVGPWSLLGFSMVIGSFFILGSIGGANSVLRMEVVKVTDKRVTFMSEILAAIRLIKTYAWEDRFKAQIDKIRNEEMRIIRKTTFLQSISNVLVPIIPVLATATSVIGYILSGNELNAAEAFTMFSVFNGLQMAIGTLPYGIRMLTETHVVLRRIQRMLLMKDVDMVTAHCDSGSAIEIEKATLAWEKPVLEKEKSDKPKREQSSKSLSRDMSAPQLPSIPVTNRLRSLSSRRHARDADKALDAEAATVINVVLTDVQLTVPRGRLLGVAGAVGSGKSSLVAAITGQLQVLCGSVRRAGSLAVVPQRAWIFNGTVRENIVFGRPFVADRYWRTVTVCALQSDLDLMENGDLSEIGERGVNLSGGQKQRVNLARAVYSDADIYLLDDPLSAVDTKVGQHIFQQCVCGELKDKTVVLVSHGVQYLSHCDEVVYMRDCKLAERGTHDQLMELQGGYYQLVSCDAASQQQEHQKKPETDKKAQELCGLCGMVLLSLLLLMYGSCRTGSAVYLQYWIDAGDGLMEERIKNMTLYNVTYDPGELAGAINDSPHVDYYILGYAGVTLLLILIGLIRTVLHNVCVVRGARRLHNKMIDSLVRCKMSFFDSTPSGRIINRLSKDMDTVDNRIPEFFEFIGQRFLIVLTQLMVPMIAYPYFALIVGVIFVLYAVMWRSLVAGVRSTKQVENVARSPLLHHLSSTVGGLAVIRAYGKENMMIERFVGLLDRHSSSLMTFRMSNSWFTLRADELGVAMLAVIGSVVLLVPGASAAEAGLILSLVYDTILIMPFLVMMCSELAAFLSAVDRCTEYCQDLDYEPPAEMPGDEKREGRWPSQGAIRLEGVSLRYRPDLPRVLHDLSLNVPAGEKVGIVGRTGAGKSTLISTLLRLMDLEEGRVLIDGVDISEVGLRQLRSNIAVIPQDPVLFTGTIR